jgi:hypothetical protein
MVASRSGLVRQVRPIPAPRRFPRLGAVSLLRPIVYEQMFEDLRPRQLEDLTKVWEATAKAMHWRENAVGAMMRALAGGCTPPSTSPPSPGSTSRPSNGCCTSHGRNSTVGTPPTPTHPDKSSSTGNLLRPAGERSAPDGGHRQRLATPPVMHVGLPCRGLRHRRWAPGHGTVGTERFPADHPVDCHLNQLHRRIEIWLRDRLTAEIDEER